MQQRVAAILASEEPTILWATLVAIKRMDSRDDENPFTTHLLDLVDDWEQDPVCAAVSAAVANAEWEFATAEAIEANTAARLEHAAVPGALEVIDLCYRLDERDARRRLACLMIAIPKYWEPPQLSEAFQALLAAR